MQKHQGNNIRNLLFQDYSWKCIQNVWQVIAKL